MSLVIVDWNPEDVIRSDGLTHLLILFHTLYLMLVFLLGFKVYLLFYIRFVSKYIIEDVLDDFVKGK